MAALSNAKHERFAQLLFKGVSACEAYVQAGYAANDGNAIRLKGNERVAARVAELQETASLKTETTVATLLEAAWNIITEARAGSDFGAASATLERAAKIAGLWVDQSKTQSANTVTVYGSEPVSAEEWAQQHAPPALQ